VGVVKGARCRVDGLLFNKKTKTRNKHQQKLSWGGKQETRLDFNLTQEVILNNDPAQVWKHREKKSGANKAGNNGGQVGQINQ